MVLFPDRWADFACSCGFASTDEASFDQHTETCPEGRLQIHRKKGVYYCQCGKTFSTRNSLTRHGREQCALRNPDGGYRYECRCGSRFRRNDNLIRHQRSGKCRRFCSAVGYDLVNTLRSRRMNFSAPVMLTSPIRSSATPQHVQQIHQQVRMHPQIPLPPTPGYISKVGTAHLAPARVNAAPVLRTDVLAAAPAITSPHETHPPPLAAPIAVPANHVPAPMSAFRQVFPPPVQGTPPRTPGPGSIITTAKNDRTDDKALSVRLTTIVNVSVGTPRTEEYLPSPVTDLPTSKLFGAVANSPRFGNTTLPVLRNLSPLATTDTRHDDCSSSSDEPVLDVFLRQLRSVELPQPLSPGLKVSEAVEAVKSALRVYFSRIRSKLVVELYPSTQKLRSLLMSLPIKLTGVMDQYLPNMLEKADAPIPTLSNFLEAVQSEAGKIMVNHLDGEPESYLRLVIPEISYALSRAMSQTTEQLIKHYGIPLA